MAGGCLSRRHIRVEPESEDGSLLGAHPKHTQAGEFESRPRDRLIGFIERQFRCGVELDRDRVVLGLMTGSISIDSPDGGTGCVKRASQRFAG